MRHPYSRVAITLSSLLALTCNAHKNTRASRDIHTKVSPKKTTSTQRFSPKIVPLIDKKVTPTQPVTMSPQPAATQGYPAEVIKYLENHITPTQQKAYKTLLSKACIKRGSANYNQQIIQQIKTLLPTYVPLFHDLNTDGEATIETHSLSVMKIFDEEPAHYKLTPKETQTLEQCAIPHIDGLMKSAIALHDIGKGIALNLCGDPSKQHQYTIPLLKHALVGLGYTEREVALASTLMQEDPLGEFARLMVDFNKTYRRIIRLSEVAQVPRRVYYKLLCNFYVADATSYPAVKKCFKRDHTNRLTPTQCTQWDALHKKLDPSQQ